ncbi:hypothetical protein [Actinomadura monticuli]|uniref:Lipoprotein n=1 Tax=Actinomadura monticuli TaxID=3097367 RepID=A0ABV4QF68_9ACTN
MLAALMLLGGCAAGGGPGESGGEPAIGSPPVIRDGTQIKLPLDAYMPEEGVLGKANDLLLQDCVRRYGFSLGAAAAPRPRPRNERRFGIVDAEVAARHGYGLPPEAKAGATGQQRQLAVPNPPPTEVLYGRASDSSRQTVQNYAGKPVPAGGCIGEVRARLSSGAPARADIRLGERLANQAHAQAEHDSRVTSAWALWSRCMAKLGYTYKTPWDAHDDPQWQRRESAGSREIRTARADIACRNETNMVGIWLAVESAYQRRLVEKNSLALAETKKLLDALQRNVADVMAGR